MFLSLAISFVLSLGGLPPFAKEEDDLIELKEYRETYSRSYLTENGKRVSYYYGSPVNYLDDNGEYQIIDTTFIKTDNSFVTSANSNIVEIRSNKITINDDLCFDSLQSQSLTVRDNYISYDLTQITSLSNGLLYSSKISNELSDSYIYNFKLCLLNDFDIKEDDFYNIFLSQKYVIETPYLIECDSDLVLSPINVKITKINNIISCEYIFNIKDLLDCDFEIRQQLSYTNYSGTQYLQHKYFKVGSSTTNSSVLLVGNNPILDPLGNAQSYKTVFGLTLPTLPSNNYSVSGTFYFRRESGTISSVRVDRATGISYNNINGTATFSTAYIGNVSLGNYTSSVNITDRLVDVYNEPSSSMNLVLSGVSSNSTGYIYTNSSSFYPFFTIAFGGYGDTQNFFAPSDQVNCCGYALWLTYGREIAPDLYSYGATMSNAGTVIVQIFNYYQNLLGIVDVYEISSYATVIPVTHRKIAFRMKMSGSTFYYNSLNPSSSDDYHFMWQMSNGLWAEKKGFGNGYYGFLTSVSAPDNNSYWGYGTSSYYNSPTYYFAIQTN